MKVACYMRCSTELQSLEAQRNILETYVKSRGWVADFYEEKESTRKTRPVKAAMLDRLRAGEYSGCLVAKLDRFARSSSEMLVQIEEIVKKGMFFISVSDNLDFSTATGILQFQILSAFAQFERSLISQRTKESLARLKKEGKILGRPTGTKDKKARKKSGYFLKEAKRRKAIDESKGVFHPLEYYINTPSKKTSPK